MEVMQSSSTILGLPGPVYAVVIFVCSGYLVSFNAEMASQMSYILIILALANAFKEVYRNIRTAMKNDTCSCFVSNVLRREFKTIRLLQSITGDLNDTFGCLILLNCIRDMIAVVSVIALLLQVPRKQGPEETDVEYGRRLAGEEYRSYGDWTIVVITLANAALGIGVCLHCSTKVSLTILHTKSGS